jgi:hypothetical protein
MTTYNIGDMIVIPYVEKIGIIIDIKYKHKYKIFWQYRSGETSTIWEEERTINMWLSKTEGQGKDNLNQYYRVPK